MFRHQTFSKQYFASICTCQASITVFILAKITNNMRQFTNHMRGPSEDLLERRPSTIRTMKIRYARNQKKIAFICLLVFTLIGFSAIGFFITWPNEHDASTHPSKPGNITKSPKSHTKAIDSGKRYLLDSPGCRVQEFDPFHSDVAQFFRKESLEPCTDHPLLSSVSLNVNGTHTLHLHKEYFYQYINGTPVSCCHSIMSIDFDSADLNSDSMESSECQPFTEDVVFDEPIEYVEVRCHIHQETAFEDNDTIGIYKNVHAFVGLTPEVEAKLKKHRNKSEQAIDGDRDVSVMIIGIDSTSRLNFKRTMPRTFRFLNNKEWQPLNVYNRVGENSISNIAALLAGADMDTLESTCWSNRNATIDDCTWIWEKFSEKGYITAYGEDAPQLDTFSFKNFSKAPTDYFLRPFMRAAERLSSTSWYEKYLKFFKCLGPVHSAHHILQYSLEFAHTFKNYPTFSVFWMNTLSHNCLCCTGGWDDIFVSYLRELEAIREDTLVIFMSNQGQNGGDFRLTRMGFYESNLPFIYLSLPRSSPPVGRPDFENLIDNENKLVSPFDLHASLLQILGEHPIPPGCPTCMSVFRKLPENRTCADAGIPQRYCACMEYDIVSDTTPYRFLGTFVVDEVNKLAKSYHSYVQLDKMCAYFHLRGMRTVQIAISPLKRLVMSFKAHSTKDQFLVTVQTDQEAVFEAMVARDNNDNLSIQSEITRIDQYEKHSKCMIHQEGKKYCFCDTLKQPLFF